MSITSWDHAISVEKLLSFNGILHLQIASFSNVFPVFVTFSSSNDHTPWISKLISGGEFGWRTSEIMTWICLYLGPVINFHSGYTCTLDLLPMEDFRRGGGL